MTAFEARERLTGPSPDRVTVLQAFVDTSSDAMFSQDERNIVDSWNRSAARIAGYREQEILGRASTLLFPDHLRAGVTRVFATVASGERVDHLETELARKDGMCVPVSMSVRPVLDDDDRFSGAVVIARDLTEQRLAQAALAEMEGRLRDGEALAHIGRWLWDIGTDAVQWSEELHRIHGVDPLEFGGTLDAHLRCVHPSDRARVRAAVQTAVLSVRPLDVEYRVASPGRDVRCVYLRAEPAISSAGEVVGLRGIGQDVTDKVSRG
ncbi:MAG: sensor hybrid histidine kinase [Actinomycetia bacterium]|nr:sensor hybrid histidine kinase [Actinomycetes bacterium]